MIYTFTIPGHVYSLKNHRPIFINRRTGKRFTGKSKQLAEYQAHAVRALTWQAKCNGFPIGLAERVLCRIDVLYRGKEPDAFGPAETLYDAIQQAGLVIDDVFLVPWGKPAVSRTHVTSRSEEKAIITLEISRI